MQTQQRNDALIAAYSEPNPNRPGADEVRLKDSGVAVWTIIGDWRAYDGDIAAVEAALVYDRQQTEVIDACLAANNADEAVWLRSSSTTISPGISPSGWGGAAIPRLRHGNAAG